MAEYGRRGSTEAPAPVRSETGAIQVTENVGYPYAVHEADTEEREDA
jgi:hypothetical protein